MSKYEKKVVETAKRFCRAMHNRGVLKDGDWTYEQEEALDNEILTSRKILQSLCEQEVDTGWEYPDNCDSCDKPLGDRPLVLCGTCTPMEGAELELSRLRADYAARGVALEHALTTINALQASGEDKYNSNYGDERLCKCGHPYYRHFDPYEEMLAVGCKYCDYTECDGFEEKK